MESSSFLVRFGTALIYAFCSVLVVFVNKILLTNFSFPSFLLVGLGQMVATIIILQFASFLAIIAFPVFDSSIPRKIFPLPVLYVLNLISGLGGTQRINLPMFTVLRRFSILLTMILEYVILGVKASYAVKISVAAMILGSVIAAMFDLTFDAVGYSLIIINDISTASNGVYMKQKLEAKELGKYGLLYYNALFMIIPVIALALLNGEFEKVYQYIDDGNMTTPVVVCLLLSFFCGFLLNYSIVLCTNYNSALTTSCVGPIKNLFVTYAGMISSGDYIFGWANFIGINVSALGSLLYTYTTFRTKAKSSREESALTVPPTTNSKKPLL